MPVMLICLSVFFASVAIVYKIAMPRGGISNLPPGPPSLPIIGHLHLLKDPIYDYLATLISRYGHNLFLRFGRVPVFITSSPSTVQECYTTKDLILADRPRSVAGEHFTYDYTFLVFAPHGPHWRTLRRVTHTEIFSLKSLQKSAYVREEEVHCLLRSLFHDASVPLQKQLVDLRLAISILTSNIVMKVAAGHRCVEMHEKETEQGRMLLQEFKDLFFPVVNLTVCDFIPVLRWIGYKGLEKNMVDLHKRRDAFLNRLIMDSRKKLTSLLNMAVCVEEETTVRSVAETFLLMQKTDPKFFTDDVIKGILMVMFIAGTETSTYSLEWAMSLLVNHPEVLKKLQEEIDSEVGQSRMVKDSDLPNLPYLKCVVKETLRMYPPAPLLLPRSATQDCTLAGYTIPKGTMVMTNAWALHRDPLIWEEPYRFLPERFENFSGELREGFMFVPFGVGRRRCPGGYMGTQVVSLGLAAMVQCFDWAAVGGKEDMAHGTGGVSLSKVKPLKVLCSPRASALHLLSSLFS